MRLGDIVDQRYRVEDLLGEGGMGSVFLAHDLTLDKKVAVKTLLTAMLADRRSAEQMKREVRLSQELRHENICATHDFNDRGGEPFIVMEYVPGDTLSNRIYAMPEHRCDLATFERLATQVLAAVEHAHKRGVVHRDLKTGNILVTPEGVAKVMDFGIAASIKETYSRTTGKSLSLSVHYASPEQINGEPPAVTMDIYSLGCIFYEMLSGEPPFTQGDVVHQQLTREPQPLEGVAKQLNLAILGCLVKDKKARLQSVADVRETLAGRRTVQLHPVAGVRDSSTARPTVQLQPGVDVHDTQTGRPTVQLEPGADVRGTPTGRHTVLLPTGRSAAARTAGRAARRRRARGGRLLPWAMALSALAVAVTIGVLAFIARDGAKPRREAQSEAPTSVAERPRADAPATATPVPEPSARAAASTPPRETIALAVPLAPRTQPSQLAPSSPSLPPTEALSARYVRIPPGTFEMGCVPGDADCDSDESRHPVTLSRAFWLGQTEVTVGEYRRYAAATGRPLPSGQDDHPLVKATWDDAVGYCEWVGGRLPTEAEWEYAARGGRVGEKFPTGDSAGHDHANLLGTSGRDQWQETAPAGSFAPNDYGLYDMSGNVWEWCADWYGQGYYQSSPATDPKGPSSGSDRVVRGGSWGSPAQDLRVSYRGRYTPSTRFVTYGFRCARNSAP